MSVFRDKNNLKDRLKGKVTDDILNEFFRDDSSKSGATDRGSFFDRPSSNRTRSRFGPSVDKFFNRSSSAGFPEDDMLRGSPRSGATDIRSHLNDLARRHPDLADQLRCFPGGGDPLYNNRSTTDAAASGESSQSGASSNQSQEQQQQQQTQGSGGDSGDQSNSRDRKQSQSEQTEPRQQDCKPGNLSNHGLRNTVPLVSSAQPNNNNNMNSNADPNNRSPRAQSAPPQGGDPNQQRFVSKIEIQPNHNQHPGQQGQETSEMYIPTSGGNNENQAPPHGQPQAHNNNNNTNTQQQQHEPAKAPHVKQPNVRHIPIFVEGRDAPIVNRDHEPSPFHHPPDPQPYHEPPPTHHHTSAHPRDRFREPIFEPVFSANSNVPLDRPFGGVAFDIPVHNDRSDRFSRSGMGPTQFGNSGFSKPSQRASGPSEKVHRVFNEQPHQQQHHSQQHHQPQSRTQSNTSHPPAHHQQAPPAHPGPAESTPAGQHAPSPPPKKMSRPKTPLEMIQEVQAEVDKLREEIEKYKGTSRKEKEYIFLDEMLTRELLKLDNVDSGGNEEIRNLRRATIKNIQATIAALEAKVPSTPSSNTSDTPSNGGEAAQAEGTTAAANENQTGSGNGDPSSSTPVEGPSSNTTTNQQPTPMEVEQPKIENNTEDTTTTTHSGQQPTQADQAASQTGEVAK
uniref:BAG domain-containing protein Samui n=2 Tax=Cacopsylla melanoneura TaxID=428564 RepID=A0A8D8XVK7_9HEMI